MIYDLIIGPIETIVEWAFLFITDKISFIGILGAIAGVSIVINFLVLPLYNVADAIKDKERLLQRKLQKQSERIKKAFKGDERFMMMQTMYRQNHYHPFYSLRSSLSILIEIPFFIAAYHYLSHNDILQTSNLNLGFMTLNLGEPDHIFKLCFGKNIFINILPITMTLINVISSMIYSKGAPRKELVQLYGLSFVFLILLYESPSGLVIYWICNNIFSLFKNAFQKSGYGLKIVYGIFSVLIFFTCFAISRKKTIHPVNLVVAWSFFVLFLTAPIFIFKIFKNKSRILFNKIETLSQSKSYNSIFYASSIVLSLFLGFVLPASVIATSPIEFSCLGKTDNPFSYVVSTFAFFTGFCFVWPYIIFKMFGLRTKFFLSFIFFMLAVSSLTNVYLFSYDYGNISQTFAFESSVIFENKGLFYIILPILVILGSALIFILLKNKTFRNIVFSMLISVCVAETALGIYKSNFIVAKYNENKENLLAAKNAGKQNTLQPVFNLAKQDSGKKNVVVIFLDRGINSFIPRFMKQYPELQNSFEGFTWYKNTLSFGNFTTVGAPAMLGGYEYTPEEINKRKDEFLRDKHNEASLIMPKLFLDAGWSVTVTDPPLPNYSEKTDLSAFKKYPEINVSELAGRYNSNYLAAFNSKGREVDEICRKQARNFCLIQVLYPKARYYFYNIVKDAVNETSFEHCYSSLYFFNQLTEFSSDSDNYFFIENDATHPNADNPDWGADNRLLITEDEISPFYRFKDSKDLVHYRVNALCIRAVAKWLDYLKDNNAYDNTRIILVSDHGRGIHLEEYEDFADYDAPAYFSALLLYKDFNAKGQLTTDTSFMMNADTLFLAKKDLSINDTNPFTGKKFSQEKNGEVHVHYAETRSTTKIYNNKQFDIESTKGWAVKDNIFNEANWKRLN